MPKSLHRKVSLSWSREMSRGWAGWRRGGKGIEEAILDLSKDVSVVQHLKRGRGTRGELGGVNYTVKSEHP